MSTTTVAERFDGRAAHYDNPVTAFVGEQELSVIRPLVPDGAAVLDYGCGTGRVTLDLLRRGCEVTAFDISVEMLALCQVKALAEGFDAEYVTEVAQLAGRTWPLITCVGVLEYYKDPLPILGSLAGLLSPGGRIVASFPNAASPLAWVYAVASRATVPAIARTAATVHRAAADAGLEVRSLRYAFPRIAPLGHTFIVELARHDA